MNVVTRLGITSIFLCFSYGFPIKTSIFLWDYEIHMIWEVIILKIRGQKHGGIGELLNWLGIEMIEIHRYFYGS